MPDEIASAGPAPAAGGLPSRWTRATVHPDLWVDEADDPRESGPAGTDEHGVLADYLRRYRLTLELKCADLDAEQLARRSVPPSTMSLLGLVRHLAEVERTWFRGTLAGQDVGSLYCTPESPDEDFDGARADDAVVAQAWADWRAEVAFAEEVLARTEDLGATVHRRGDPLPVRDVVVHLVEEYARHCGHADLLRECVDGRIGQ
ncbi:DinB family protein [Microlunatus capsulatus]|uniref:Damage-inducible protein DinB n=1 Tax=Microlunatus capsulatus TaxID=99117 RepID=A0ABS4ZDI8_9ACTN|nr:DinB family protein [Microlunatus capsulatus]MBP2419101.1 putative damage-inducible protein DinB [Microlunatus capsulatus]